MCLDRLVPTVKATAAPINPGLSATGTLAEQGAAIYQAAAQGDIGTDEAGAMMQILQGQARIVKISDLVDRIAALEERSAK